MLENFVKVADMPQEVIEKIGFEIRFR